MVKIISVMFYYLFPKLEKNKLCGSETVRLPVWFVMLK